ncbi:MAG: hypothetical protein FJ303_27805 [Planctomycetes bacterium]|nr:hypothetical protein [Planctomycetota bacterium]
MQIQAGLLNGKSIGWLPTKTHYADMKEAERIGCKEGTVFSSGHSIYRRIPPLDTPFAGPLTEDA